MARNPELRSFAPQLRYLRGRTSGERLQQLLGPDRSISSTDAALISAFGGGHRQACVGKPEEEVRPLLQRTLAQLLHVLGQHRE